MIHPSSKINSRAMISKCENIVSIFLLLLVFRTLLYCLVFNSSTINQFSSADFEFRSLDIAADGNGKE